MPIQTVKKKGLKKLELGYTAPKDSILNQLAFWLPLAHLQSLE